jgi:hypothetical protein
MIKEKKICKKITEKNIPKTQVNRDAIIQDIYLLLGKLFTHAMGSGKNQDLFHEIKYTNDYRLYEQVLNQLNCNDHRVETVIQPRYKIVRYLVVDKKLWME